jgi:hypothetical protein
MSGCKERCAVQQDIELNAPAPTAVRIIRLMQFMYEELPGRAQQLDQLRLAQIL